MKNKAIAIDFLHVEEGTTSTMIIPFGITREEFAELIRHELYEDSKSVVLTDVRIGDSLEEVCL